MKPYKDTAGVWHITTTGRDRPASDRILEMALRNLEPFTINGGNFRGGPPPDEISDGVIPGEYMATLRKAVYIVWSFGVPIAWHVTGLTFPHTPEFWAIPPLDYSKYGDNDATMWRHQSILSRALGAVHE